MAKTAKTTTIKAKNASTVKKPVKKRAAMGSRAKKAAEIARSQLEQDIAAAKRQWMFWLLAFAVFLAFMFVFRDILLPFLAGMALAYFLDPVADFFERLGASRMVATCIILFIFLILFVLGLMVLIPVLASQMGSFLENFPSYIAKLQELIASSNSEWLKDLLGSKEGVLHNDIKDLMGQAAGWITTLLKQLWNSGKAIVDVLSIFVITPVVAFYLLYDWDHMVERVDGWLPRDHQATIRTIMGDINEMVAGFIRGQGALCIILAIYYGVSLTLAGLNFGLLIGVIVGIISFIPYLGAIIGLVLSVGLAVVQFWPDYISVGIIALIFVIGQFLEGNILQPKLVGENIGLHPVWLMFALLAFGSMFGFAGLLIAVPASAAIGVLVRFALNRYLESPLYKGSGTHNQQEGTNV